MADSEISLLKRGDPSRRWLALAWLVLIAFRTFRPLFGEARTRAAIQGVLARRFKKRTRLPCPHN